MLLIIGCNSRIAKFIKHKFRKENLLLADKKKGFDYYIDLENIYEIELDPRITHAILFSGITSIEFCDKNPTFAEIINGKNSIKLINMLNKKGIKVLFPSSTCVFSSMKLDENFESTKTNSDNKYGQIKSFVEKNIIRNKLNTILRISKVITPDDKLLTFWKKELTNKREIQPFYDLKISPVSVFTVADYLYQWYIKDFSGIVHLSPSSDITYYELAKKLCSFLSVNASLIKAKSTNDLTQKIIYNPKISFLSCAGENSKKLDLKIQLKKIFESLI